MQSLLIHTPRYRTFSFGSEHPMRPVRLHLAYTLIAACHLLEGRG